MRYFVCLLPRAGAPVFEWERRRFDSIARSGDSTHEWRDLGGAAVLLHDDGIGSGPAIAHHGSWVGVGIVRLDNRRDLLASQRLPSEPASDLEVVLSVLARRGECAVRDLLGDFAFVAWEPHTGQVIAARDAFGVRCLYHRQRGGVLAFASRAEALADGATYDIQYLTELIATCEIAPERTVYAGVDAVPAGATMLASGSGPARIVRYWSPEDFESGSAPLMPVRARCEEFRTLFADAVRTRLTDGPQTWAILSGGLDSSSVVSTAHWLWRRNDAPHGVQGAVSWVYRWSPDSDERDYAECVVRHTDVRWETMTDTWFWRDDGAEPPHTDLPDPAYAIYARDRRTAEVVREAGGTVLLTGFGSDQYLLGNMFFFADWLAAGRVREAVVEMIRRAALGRVSFWKLAFQNAVLPMLPGPLRRHYVASARVPAWISEAGATQWDLAARLGGAREYEGRVGHKYADLVLTSMRSIPRVLRMYSVFEDAVDVRHPFLHRPLVEYALRLPPELCVQPNARKWVLREAMRGVLPEAVRTRVGKGSNGGCIGQSLLHEHAMIDRLLRTPMLAELGCLEPGVLRKAVETMLERGVVEECATLSWTLAVELWLQVRSGRWLAEAGGLHESTPPARATLTTT